MKRNKNKEKKEYEKTSTTGSFSSLSNVFTKEEIDEKINSLAAGKTAKDFVLDELASYAINNMKDVDPSDSAALTVKVCANSSALDSLSLSQRRAGYLY